MMKRNESRENTSEKLMRMYADTARIWSSPHMSGIPMSGWCDINSIGGEALRECVGDELYHMLKRAVHRLKGADGESTRRKCLIKMYVILSTMDLQALEEHCIDVLQLPWSPAYLRKRYLPPKPDPFLHVTTRSADELVELVEA